MKKPWLYKYQTDNWNIESPTCRGKIMTEQDNTTEHTHEFNELVFVFSGAGIHKVDNERYPLTRGDVFVMHGSHFHGFEETNHLHLKMILFSPAFFQNFSKRIYDLPGFQTLFVHEPRYRKNHKFKSKLRLTPEQLNNIGHIFNIIEENQENKPLGFQAVVEYLFGYMTVLVCRYYSESTSSKPKALLRLSPVITYIEEHFNDPILISELAKKTYMAESSFRRIFKQITGLSPIDYIIRFRIEKAVEMMTNKTEDLVINIATTVGFENSSYFTKKFKSIMGTTPIAYMKKLRGLEK